jgi:hypothetical protein
MLRIGSTWMYQPRPRQPRFKEGFAIVDKEAEEIAAEGKAYQKLKHLPEYSTVQVTATSVATPHGNMLDLTCVENVRKALVALRKLHCSHVIHGDVKKEHLRAKDNAVFFIDFEHHIDMPLQRSTGYTRKYASLDLLVCKNVHPLDDYEALFMTVLDKMGQFPPDPSACARVDSLKAWLQWKVAVMETVFKVSQQPNLSTVQSFALFGLLRVWTTPRNESWLSDEFHRACLMGATIDLKCHRESLWKLFAGRLTRGTRDERNWVNVYCYYLPAS